MTYLIFKHIHLSCAAISIGLFVYRLVLVQLGRPLAAWPLRVLPHVVDSLLLASAIALVVMSGQYPIAQGWLTAKVLALVLYIVLGTLALKRAPTRRAKLAYGLAALATVAYIVGAALQRSAWSWLAG